jgi:hypothetical protein
MNDIEINKEKAIEQFVRRRRYATQIEKIDSSGLHAGSPVYFYCKDCGIPTEVLPEDFLFSPLRQCSQCEGLCENKWLEDAKKLL